LKIILSVFALFDLTEFWHRKIIESSYFFFRSSAPFIGSDLRDVGEECQW